ncbi:MAG: hypothetical protein Q8K02_13315 [Flavobacterium sp.]|nr:hypothetical protein [Flavobacterium sp.]
MKNNLLFALMLIVHFSYSQETKISKNELLKAFKETIVQTKKGKIETDSNPWFTENTNEIYYKNDTIVLKNAKSFKRDYCKIINWNFYKKNAFVIGDADYCNEPPTRKVTKPKDWVNLKVHYVENNLIMELFNENKMIDKFKVILLEKKESEYEKNDFDYILKIIRLTK